MGMLTWLRWRSHLVVVHTTGVRVSQEGYTALCAIESCDCAVREGMAILTPLKRRSHLVVVGATLLQAVLQQERHLLLQTHSA